jgi:hypothetical protein
MEEGGNGGGGRRWRRRAAAADQIGRGRKNAKENAKG